MNLQTEKIELVKMLLETDDRSLLKGIRSLFINKNDTVPQWIIDGTRDSQQQLRNGQGVSYEDVKRELDQI